VGLHHEVRLRRTGRRTRIAQTYTPDRWRDLSIIAQSAAKVAADLYLAQDSEKYTGERFPYQEWHKAVFDSTLELVGFPPDQASVPGDSGGSKQRESGKRPYADTQFKFGKYKGMTIGEIDDSVGSDGKTGHSYLEWFSDQGDDSDFMVKAVRGYLRAA